jgi:hypothetical protein
MPSLHEIEQQKAREREALYREQMRKDGDHQERCSTCNGHGLIELPIGSQRFIDCPACSPRALVTGSADPEWQDVVFSHMDVIDADYYDEIDYDEVEDAPDGEDV